MLYARALFLVHRLPLSGYQEKKNNTTNNTEQTTPAVEEHVRDRDQRGHFLQLKQLVLVVVSSLRHRLPPSIIYHTLSIERMCVCVCANIQEEREAFPMALRNQNRKKSTLSCLNPLAFEHLAVVNLGELVRPKKGR